MPLKLAQALLHLSWMVGVACVICAVWMPENWIQFSLSALAFFIVSAGLASLHNPLKGK